MSVTNKEKIDGIGKSKIDNSVILMISDHLDWANEHEHLIILQDKINAYIGFIESGQIKEIYPEDEFEGAIFKIYFQYDVPEKCIEFLNNVNKQLVEVGIKIIAEIS